MADLAINESIAEIREVTTSQDLSVGALSYTTSIARDFRLISVFFHFSGNVTQTVSVTLDASAGANYDTKMRSLSLTNNSDVQFVPEISTQDFKDGNEIKIECTNTGTPAVTVYATIVYELV